MPLPTRLNQLLTTAHPEIIALEPDALLQLEAYLEHPDRPRITLGQLQSDKRRGVRTHQEEADRAREFLAYLRRVLDYNHRRVGGTTTAATSEELAPAKPAVEAWRQLGLGLDGHQSLAFVPAPSIGERVRKGDGISLPLTGKRWRVVLTLAGAAPDGRRVLKRELRQHLEAATGRSRAGRVTAAQAGADQLRTDRKGDKTFTDALSDLRRTLRAEVDGPEDGLFVDLGTEIDLGFVVRGLIEDETRHFRFGAPPAS